MHRRKHPCLRIATKFLSMLLTLHLFSGLVWAQAKTPIPADKGRIYIFRMVRPFGAHIDDYVTINGLSVKRITPGNGVYCDVKPGDYVVGLAQRKAPPLKVSVAAGHDQYVCVMLHHRGATPRSGALGSDQAFDIRLLDPAYGAQRAAQYQFSPANCQP